MALKRIREEYVAHSDLRARFMLEAEITGLVEHPGVVPVYGRGHDAQGCPFYAMRFIQGKTLQQAIEDYHRASLATRRIERCGIGIATPAPPLRGCLQRGGLRTPSRRDSSGSQARECHDRAVR